MLGREGMGFRFALPATPTSPAHPPIWRKGSRGQPGPLPQALPEGSRASPMPHIPTPPVGSTQLPSPSAPSRLGRRGWEASGPHPGPLPGGPALWLATASVVGRPWDLLAGRTNAARCRDSFGAGTWGGLGKRCICGPLACSTERGAPGWDQVDRSCNGETPPRPCCGGQGSVHPRCPQVTGRLEEGPVSGGL